jgi:diacylglycerol kinase family enzyme
MVEDGSASTRPPDPLPPRGSASAPGRRSHVWLARLALLLIAAAVILLLVGAGWRSVGLVLVGVAGLAVCAAGLWWFLTSHSRLRSALAALAVTAPVAVLVLYVAEGLLWVILGTLLLAGLGAVAARTALAGGEPSSTMPEHEARPPSRPFVIMNPRSGGGKVAQFDLERKATALGAEVVLLDVTQTVDVAELARSAVTRGADLLGVAGGDGTQALVAGVAAEHDVPLLVISAGTRNHFALDLGLDRSDPSRCLDALSDGIELRIDLGQIGGRTFVNNASFGAYAEIVRDPAYREDKVRSTLQQLPDLLLGRRGAQLRVCVDGAAVLTSPQAVLVSNNAYATDDIAGLSRRARLDTGRLGLSAIRVASARQAAGLLGRTHSDGLTLSTGRQVVIDADTAEVPVGIDGEAVSLPTPVSCTIRPVALRVRVPRDRPGAPAPRPALNWTRLSELALGRGAETPDVASTLESQLHCAGWWWWRPVRPRAGHDAER